MTLLKHSISVLSMPSVVIFLFFIAVAHLSGTNTPPAQSNTRLGGASLAELPGRPESLAELGQAGSGIGGQAGEAWAAFSCSMHVHTRMSSGMYQLPELTKIAKAQGIDAIFLSDNLLTSIEFGLPPLRHIFWAGHREEPSMLTIGWKRCLAEVQRENERQPRDARGQQDVLYIPGVEIVPRFFWSGSLLKTNLVCHNHQRNLILLGTYDAHFLANLPLTCGYIWGRDTVWIVITRLLLILFIGACLGFMFMPRMLARRLDPGYYPGLSYGTPLGCAARDANGVQHSSCEASTAKQDYSPGGNPGHYTVGEIRRSFFFGLILPLVLLMILVNFIASMMPAFKIYGRDDPERFEQRVLDAIKREKLISFWAHPEAPDHQEFKYCGVPFTVDTQPYPEVLLKTKDYTGFAGVNEGENKFVDPGSVWDVLLKQYLDGRRDEPVWCFGEILYRHEGRDGKKLSNVETIVWAPEKKAAALLESIRNGYFYARSNFRGQSLFLDQWQVAGIESGQTGHTTNGYVDISLRVSARLAGEADRVFAEPSDLSAEAIRAKGEVPIAKRIGTKEGEKAEVLIIRNGEVIKKSEMILPFELNFRDNLPPAPPTIYYRAIISGKYPVRLVTNPMFIRLRQAKEKITTDFPP